MKHFKKFILFFCFSAGLIAIDSCKKEETDTETTSATDNSLCEGEFSRFAMNTNSIAVGDSGVQKGIFPVLPSNACPDYWYDPLDTANGFPVTMYINYGTDNDGDGIIDVGCVDNDGKTRKGTIVAKFMSQWDAYPATVVLNLDTLGGFWVNNIRYKGQINLTKNSATSFTQKVSNGGCSTSSWNIAWNCDRTLTVNMGDPFTQNDDRTTLTGTANGTDRNGKTFSVDITNALIRDFSCRWVSSGTVTLKLEGKKDRIIDFGDGTCDDRATVTIDGNTFEFALKDTP